jgi:hypothetical protein
MHDAKVLDQSLGIQALQMVLIEIPLSSRGLTRPFGANRMICCLALVGLEGAAVT